MDIASDATIFILIDHDLCQWREDEVDRLFILEEASIIKAIPLSFSNKRDMIFWPRSRDGVYSMKSGYKMLMELEDKIEIATSVSSIDELKSTWNAIWSLKVQIGLKSSCGELGPIPCLQRLTWLGGSY